MSNERLDNYDDLDAILKTAPTPVAQRHVDCCADCLTDTGKAFRYLTTLIEQQSAMLTTQTDMLVEMQKSIVALQAQASVNTPTQATQATQASVASKPWLPCTTQGCGMKRQEPYQTCRNCSLARRG